MKRTPSTMLERNVSVGVISENQHNNYNQDFHLEVYRTLHHDEQHEQIKYYREDDSSYY